MSSKKAKRTGFVHSKIALALPITYMILFVSTLLLISVTYVIAIDQLNNQKHPLQEMTAQQDMETLADNIVSVSSQPGSASTLDFRDSGGQIVVGPSSGNLTVSITDNNSVDSTVFNQTTGQVTYNLAAFASANIGFYLRGDSSTIANQTGASPSQLYFAVDNQKPSLDLQYRPTVSYAIIGEENGQAINCIRVYIVNLNSSDPIALHGKLPLRIACTGTTLTSVSYSIPYQVGDLTVTSQIGSAVGSVKIPIVNALQGAIIKFDIVVSNVSIERCIT